MGYLRFRISKFREPQNYVQVVYLPSPSYTWHLQLSDPTETKLARPRDCCDGICAGCTWALVHSFEAKTQKLELNPGGNLWMWSSLKGTLWCFLDDFLLVPSLKGLTGHQVIPENWCLGAIGSLLSKPTARLKVPLGRSQNQGKIIPRSSHNLSNVNFRRLWHLPKSEFLWEILQDIF